MKDLLKHLNHLKIELHLTSWQGVFVGEYCDASMLRLFTIGSYRAPQIKQGFIGRYLWSHMEDSDLLLIAALHTDIKENEDLSKHS